MTPNHDLCPPRVRESLTAYWRDGVSPGSFVRACLENDLMGAFRQADADNLEALPHIVAWIYWHLPINVYGSPGRVNEHLDAMRAARATTAPTPATP